MISLILGLLPLVKVCKEKMTLTKVTAGIYLIVVICYNSCPLDTHTRFCGNKHKRGKYTKKNFYSREDTSSYEESVGYVSSIDKEQFLFIEMDTNYNDI